MAERQRAALLALPDTETMVARHHGLDAADLSAIGIARTPATRLEVYGHSFGTCTAAGFMPKPHTRRSTDWPRLTTAAGPLDESQIIDVNCRSVPFVLGSYWPDVADGVAAHPLRRDILAFPLLIWSGQSFQFPLFNSARSRCRALIAARCKSPDHN